MTKGAFPPSLTSSIGPMTRKPLPIIEARGVIVDRNTTELATLGQINIAPNKTTTDRIKALSIYEHDQITVDVTTYSFLEAAINARYSIVHTALGPDLGDAVHEWLFRDQRLFGAPGMNW